VLVSAPHRVEWDQVLNSGLRSFLNGSKKKRGRGAERFPIFERGVLKEKWGVPIVLQKRKNREKEKWGDPTKRKKAAFFLVEGNGRYYSLNEKTFLSGYHSGEGVSGTQKEKMVSKKERGVFIRKRFFVRKNVVQKKGPVTMFGWCKKKKKARERVRRTVLTPTGKGKTSSFVRRSWELQSQKYKSDLFSRTCLS